MEVNVGDSVEAVDQLGIWAKAKVVRKAENAVVLNFPPWNASQMGSRDTVPVKCKLTVTRNSNDSTRSSILETRILRVSSLESSHSSFESSHSSFESSSSSFESRRQRIYRSINFSRDICMSILLVCFFSTLEAVSDSTFVNRLAYRN